MAKSPYPELDEDLGRPIPYDPNFHGPRKERSCTDVICLFIFMVFIGCWAGLGIYALTQGDPNILLVPTDSDGAHCGIDTHVKDKPYLFFFDLTQCIGAQVPFTGCPTPQVCVARCPTITYYPQASEDVLLNNAICKTGVHPQTTNELLHAIENHECAKWYLPSTSVQKRCLPTLASLNTTIIPDSVTTLEQAIKNIKAFMQAQEIGLNIVQDITNSWWQILAGLGIAMLICIVYITIMRWIAPVMVWLSILGVILLLGFCVYFTGSKYKHYSDITNSEDENFVDRHMDRNSWLALLIISTVILIIIILVLVFLRKRILLAISLIKEGSKAVASVTSALFFPIVPWILQIAVLTYAVAVSLYLSTVGSPLYKIRNMDSSCQCGGEAIDYKEGSVCNDTIFREYCHMAGTPSQACMTTTCFFSSMDNPKFTIYLHAFNVFGFFWGAFFVSALGQMILATVFATWYWEWNKSDLPFFAVTTATAQTFRFHMGTLAFGSLIIAICRMIRVVLEYIDHKLKKYDNAFTRAILCCLKCFFWCLEKFLKFISRNAYIMCAIHGKNFCASAKDAFGLLMRNILRVFVLDKVTDFLFFLSKVLVTAGVGCIAYAVFVYRAGNLYQSELNYDLVPVVVIVICTYFITTVFFSVYNMAVDTLFLCFLEDCERNDGSAQKPYYMSRQLMKILGRKNKLH